MKIKSLISLILTVTTLPLIAYADLTTTNNTNEYSTAFVTSSGICAGTFVLQNGSTPPHDTVVVSVLSTKFLCGFQTPCTAVMVMAKNQLDAMHCRGHIIAIAEINDLTTSIISSAKMLDTNYELLGVGTNHTTLNQINVHG